jgi:hypothetical protein
MAISITELILDVGHVAVEFVFDLVKLTGLDMKGGGQHAEED